MNKAEAFRILILALWSAVATLLASAGIYIVLDACSDWLRSRRRGP